MINRYLWVRWKDEPNGEPLIVMDMDGEYYECGNDVGGCSSDFEVICVVRTPEPPTDEVNYDV